VVVTASEDAGAGWIDRWDEGASVRFATGVPDPLAFEREYLSVLSGEEVTQVRPDPTITITFDGEHCTIEPRRLSAGSQVVAYVDERGAGQGGVLLELNRPLTYQELRDIVGPDGSILPEDTEEPKGLRFLAFVEDLAEAETRPSVVVGMCSSSRGGEPPFRVWLSAPVEVAP
jgi:hypothetical protein